MILIGLGGNLPTARYGPPRETLEAALVALAGVGVAAISRSRWYLTAPVPRSDQPDFVNGVIAASTTAGPTDLLALLHRVEETFGRVRSVPNAARPVDLDLLDYNGLLRDGEPPILPHPRLHQRAFVLYPLRDVAPGWVHPRLGKSVDALIGALPPDQPIRVLV